MRAFAAGDARAGTGAAAAVRSASQALDRLRSHGAAGGGRAPGALDVLARLSTASDEGLSIGELARAAGVSSPQRHGAGRRCSATTWSSGSGPARPQVGRNQDHPGRTGVAGGLPPARSAMSAVFRASARPNSPIRHLCLRLVDNQNRIEQYLNDVQPDQTAS